MSQASEDGGPGRRAVVTGASAGIGAAFAKRLARDAYDLTVVARSRERLDALAVEIRDSRGVAVEVLPADLTEEAGLSRVAAHVADAPPDLLVNNAGFGTVGRFAELDPEGEDREIRLNVLALSRLTRATLPGMLARGHGGIIQVSSLAGQCPGPYNATYAATKAFVTSFSEALYEELRGSGVRIQALLPGFTRTEFQERAGVDAARIPGFAWMSAEAVVEASLASLARNEAVCVPGAGNRLLSGLQQLAPRSLSRRVLAATLGRTLD